MTIGTAYRNVLLDRAFGDKTRSVALHSSDPGIDGAAGLLEELGRAESAFTNPATVQVVSNLSDLVWSNVSGSSAILVGISVWETAADGGRLIWTGLLDDRPITLPNGQNYRIPPGELDVSLD